MNTTKNYISNIVKSIRRFNSLIVDHPAIFNRSWVESEENIKSLEKYISDKSYIFGYQPSTMDSRIFELISADLNIIKKKGENDKSSHQSSRVTQYNSY